MREQNLKGESVLCVTALGAPPKARQKVYEVIQNIHFPHMHYRTDIGFRELQRQ